MESGIRGTGCAVLRGSRGRGETPKSFNLWLSADVTIDDRGHVTSLNWDACRAWPAVGGQPASRRRCRRGNSCRRWSMANRKETRTVLSIKVRATGQDDGAMSLQITDAHTGPKNRLPGPPDLSARGLQVRREREWSPVDLEVQQDGRAEILGMTFDSKNPVYAGTATSFLKATRQAVATWKFRPEFVANRAVKTRMQVPVDLPPRRNFLCARSGRPASRSQICQ